MNARRVLSAAAVALLLSSSGCRSAPPSGDPTITPAATVRVSSSEVIIEIPVPAHALWQWHTGEVPENTVEYEWQIYLGEPDAPRYGLGFLLFDHPHATPNEGTLSELIRAGQTNLWSLHDRRAIRHGAAVQVEVADNGLVIRLENPVIVQELFGSRPPRVTLVVQGPGSPRNSEPVTVNYVGG